MDGGSSPALVPCQCTLGIRDWGTLSWDAQAPPLRPSTVVDSHSNPKRRSRMSRVDHRAGFGSGVRARAAAHGPLDWEKCGLELSVRAGAPGGCGPVRLTDEGVPLGWQDVEHWTSRGAPPTVVYNHTGEPKMRTHGSCPRRSPPRAPPASGSGTPYNAAVTGYAHLHRFLVLVPSGQRHGAQDESAPGEFPKRARGRFEKKSGVEGKR